MIKLSAKKEVLLSWPPKRKLRLFLPTALFVAVVLLMTVHSSFAHTFQEGYDAYQTGDYEKAYKIWKWVAERGDADAQYNIGFLYDKGLGVPQNYVEALKWYQKASSLKHPRALYSIGLLYFNGSGVTQSYLEAAKWYEKAAKEGDAIAQNDLGSLYEEGKGVAQNYNEAFRWYKEAANQENKEAQFNLARCYKNGIGVNINDQEAIFWYYRAAKQGFSDALRNLENYAKAGDSNAQNFIGNIYLAGDGIQKHEEKAMFWLQKAAEQENPAAQYNLGLAFFKKQDYAAALNFFRKASHGGYVDAENMLGIMFCTGKGLKKDIFEAETCFLKAAMMNDMEAKMNLATLYFADEADTLKDPIKAYVWTELALRQYYKTWLPIKPGKQDFARILIRLMNPEDDLTWLVQQSNKLKSEMKRAKRKEAQALAKKWEELFAEGLKGIELEQIRMLSLHPYTNAEDTGKKRNE